MRLCKKESVDNINVKFVSLFHTSPVNYRLFRFYDLVMVLTEGDLDLNLDNAEAGPIQFE